jgi:hypothetical protein
MDLPPAAERRRAGDRLRALDGRGHPGRIDPGLGTLIRHARGNELQAGAVGALMIAVIEPSQFTRLVAGSGRT